MAEYYEAVLLGDAIIASAVIQYQADDQDHAEERADDYAERLDLRVDAVFQIGRTN